MMNGKPLLQVRDLVVQFKTRQGLVQAVDHISFDVNEGEIVGIVGESGSGKSTVGLTILQLLPQPAGRIAGGQINYRGKDLLKLKPKHMQAVRGEQISMTFQDPMTFLNPVMKIGDQIVETILHHQDITKKEAAEVALEWIANVRINEPQRVFNSYPHQLSGGMRQRVLIAIALSCEPSLIIADEPTTALDVTIQRGIIELLISIRDRFNTAILLITHDLGVVSEMCDRVYVMYAGQIFETTDVDNAVMNPQNPYTQALLRSARSIDEYHTTLYSIGGSAPSLIAPPSGCRFRDRCPQTFERCKDEPPMFPIVNGGWSKCWLHAKEVVPHVD
jgi:peptide/nickel transport system ATP-binding protein